MSGGLEHGAHGMFAKLGMMLGCGQSFGQCQGFRQWRSRRPDMRTAGHSPAGVAVHAASVRAVALGATVVRAAGVPVAVASVLAAPVFVLLATAPVGAQGIAPVAQPAPAAAAPAKAVRAKAGKAAKSGQPAAGEEAKKVDPAAAERQLEAGIKSFQAGKHEAAVQSLNGALQGGGLPSARMARALYYRGLAYKAQGKPAQSISDLTSAVWLKGGLDDKERADALAQRAAAYREAGLGEPPALDANPKAPRTAADAVPRAAAGSSAVVASAPASGGGIGGFFGNLFGGSSSTPQAPAPVAAAAPASTGSVVPTVPKAEVSSWSGDTKTAAVGVAPAAKAAVAPAAAVAAQPVRLAAAQAQTQTQAQGGVTPPPSHVAAAPSAAAPVAAAPAVAAPAAASGKFRLQVAAVRSRQEADAIAAKLKKEYGRKLASRDPVIDEAAIGNMGTFYRVRVGPYADANEPRRLCVTLRSSGGYDCLVVTQ